MILKECNEYSKKTHIAFRMIESDFTKSLEEESSK